MDVRYRNHVANEWSSLGLRMQSRWERILDLIGDDSFYLYVYGIYSMTEYKAIDLK